MDETRKYLSVVDYVIFGLTLLVSIIIGVYFAWKQKKNQTSADYLLAGRSVSWFPIFVSLVVSFFSPVGVMGISAQIYSTGVTFSLNALAFIFPIILNAFIFAPIFRKLQLVSVNEYLELRFSKGTRLLGCCLFILQYLLFLSIVLYAPSLALYTVAGVPLTASILVTGGICTFYTTLGGMKAVIWTDVFQAAIMVIGLMVTAIFGIINVGSMEKVYEIGKKYKRFELNYNPDPRSYHTVWGTTIGLSFSIMSGWTITQPTVQRIVSAKSLRDAKLALYFSFIGLLLFVAILTLDGLVVFAAFVDCGPFQSGKIKSFDQILPYFVINKLNNLNGIAGLFSASLFSFALSTLSSALNSMSAILLEDIVKMFNPTISDKSQTVVSKVIACVCGAFVIGFAFVIPKMGGVIIKIAIQLYGVIGGPYFAMFALGVLTKRTNKLGVIVGTLFGFGVGMMFSIGKIVYPSNQELLPVSLANCGNVTNASLTFIYPKPPPDHQNVFADIVSISYLWYGFISVSLSCIVGYLVSLCSGSSGNTRDEGIINGLLYWNSSNCICGKKEEEDTVDCQILDQDLMKYGLSAEKNSITFTNTKM